MPASLAELSTWLTRGTVWCALILYLSAEVRCAVAIRRGSPNPSAARALLTAGGAAFMAHIACAFSFHHHWSHTAAYVDTAQQTAALTGWHWGGGLYINYVFALVWLGEILWWWAAREGYFQRRAGITRAVRGFFLFMIFNGAVVFVSGPARWLGLFLCAVLVVCWWPRRAAR